MRARKAVLLAILPAMLLSCNSYAESFCSLDEGETWTYQIVGPEGGAAKMTIVNMAKRELAGRSVTPQKIEINGQAFFSFVGEDPEGWFVLAEQLPNQSEPEIKSPVAYGLRRPLKEGTAWQVKTKTTAKLPIVLQASIQSATETVTVPAGTFERCLKVVEEGQASQNFGSLMGKATVSVENISWYCPGVGLVKASQKESSNHALAGMGSQLFFQLEAHSRHK